MQVQKIVNGDHLIVADCGALDLVSPLLALLEAMSPTHARRLAEAYSEVLDQIEAGRIIDGPWVRWLVDDLKTLLDAVAPEGYYFGSPFPEGSIPVLGYFLRETADV